MLYLTSSNVTQYFLKKAGAIWGKARISVLSAWEVKEETYVNYIFKVNAEVAGRTITVYLRQTRDHVKTRPLMKIEPDRIIFEANILNLLNKIISDLVPKVMYLDRQNNIAFLNDIKRNGKLLVNELVAGRAHPETGAYLGEKLALIHTKTLRISHKLIRGDVKTNNEAVAFHLGMRLGPAKKMFPDLVDRLMVDSQKAQKTLVLGDLASKNIFVEGKKVRFLDLERAFVGDPAFDIAFLFCHYLVEIKPERIRQSIDFITEFIRAYRIIWRRKISLSGWRKFENRIIRFLGVTIIYRLYGFYLVRDLPRDKERWRGVAEQLVGLGSTNLVDTLDRISC